MKESKEIQKNKDYFVNDDIAITPSFDYDYSFCDSNCKNYKCGRNFGSKSYLKMISESEAPIVFTASNFSTICKSFSLKGV